MLEPFYDTKKSYEENLAHGPFGAFADGEVFENKGEPQFEFCGQKVYSPFGISAGPLINGKFVKAALDKGFDVPVYKTVRTEAKKSHAWPNVLTVEAKDKIGQGGELKAQESVDTRTITASNSFGVPSAHPSVWQPDLAQAVRYAKKGQIVVGSFQGTKRLDGSVEGYINDFVLAAKLVKDAGVKVLEANLSCPNEGSEELLCFDIPRVKTIVERIRQTIGTTPLILKIAYFWDKDAFDAFVKEVGGMVEGIAAINTIPARVVDEQGRQALPGRERVQSGVGGKAIKWAGIEAVTRLKELRDELSLGYTIVGMGGVTEVQDFFDYRQAGGDVVMSATGAMWNPYLAKEIKDKL